MTTAMISEPIDGNKLYQRRAREAFPLLVRQAEAGNTIYYSDLAEELGMPNPRNLNYVLGSIGQTLENISKHWQREVPPIQSLVINRNSNMPGEGIGWFIEKKADYTRLPRAKQRELFRRASQRVFAYPYWKDVLRELKLVSAAAPLTPATEMKPPRGGEGEAHRALKEYVARHPEILGLPPRTPQGVTEFLLKSGDALDVSFHTDAEWVAAEVKARTSGDDDVQRGIFQCVKYDAVMKAEVVMDGSAKAVRVVLVLESELPPHLVPARNALAIEVLDGVKPRRRT